jgi:hypothetical protein
MLKQEVLTQLFGAPVPVPAEITSLQT